MGGSVTKEVDEWLSHMTKLLKEREVKEDPNQLLRSVVEQVLEGIGKDKLQTMDATAVLVAVRDGIPKVPGNMLRPDYIKKSSDLVAKVIEQYFSKNKITSGGPLKTFGDGVVNELEARIAKYVSELPTDLKVKREGLTLIVSKKGVAAKIEGQAFDLTASAGSSGNKLQLDTKDLKLTLINKGENLAIDAKLKVIRGSLKILAELHAREGKLKPGDDSEEARALRAKLDATYRELRIQVDASLKELAAKIQYLKKDAGLKEVCVKLVSDYESVKAKLKVVYEKRDTKILVEALAEAEKLEVKISAEAKTAGGFDVKGELDATLERLKAKIEVFKKNKDHEFKFVASLQTKYDDLAAQASVIYTKTGKEQLELVAKFEATLEEVKAEIDVALKTDEWSISAGAAVSSSGTASGKVGAMVKLNKGVGIMGGNTYLTTNFAFNEKGWSGFVGLSLTSPPRPADVAAVFRNAEANINNAYSVFGNPKYDGASTDAIMSAVQKKLQALPPAVKLDVGFVGGGGFPSAALPKIPTFGGVGLTVSWF